MTPPTPSLKVLEVVQPETGGAATHVAYLCAHLARRGHDVTVAGPPTSILAVPTKGSYTYHVLPSLVREPNPGSDLRALKDIIGLVRSSDWDVVHLHSSKAGFLGRAAAMISGTKAAVVYTPHCFAFLAHMGSAPTVAYRALERLAGFVGDTILVSRWEYVGGWNASVLRPRRAWVIPNGIDLDAAPVSADTRLSGRRDDASKCLGAPTIGTVTRLQRAKGVDVFLKMAAKIREQVQSASFVIVGDGPDAEALRSLAVRLGLADSCRFVGHSDDVPGHLAEFTLFVLSSRYESHPLALLEAMAAQLPVVATAVGGVPEIIRDGIDGVLVPPNDPAAAARAVLDLLSDGETASRLAASGRRRHESSFTVERSMRETEHLYLRLASRT